MRKKNNTTTHYPLEDAMDSERQGFILRICWAFSAFSSETIIWHGKDFIRAFAQIQTREHSWLGVSIGYVSLFLFRRRKVLRMSDGIEDVGAPVWDLSLCLLLSWIVCYLSAFKGIRLTAKVSVFGSKHDRSGVPGSLWVPFCIRSFGHFPDFVDFTLANQPHDRKCTKAGRERIENESRKTSTSGSIQVSGDAPTLPWVRSGVWVGARFGLALREGWVDTSPESWIIPHIYFEWCYEATRRNFKRKKRERALVLVLASSRFTGGLCLRLCLRRTCKPAFIRVQS